MNLNLKKYLHILKTVKIKTNLQQPKRKKSKKK